MPQDTRPDRVQAAVTATAPGYMSGFGNSFETEALAGALPIGRNSPQKCKFGLYAEQLSGSPFTAPRAANERSWLYRIRASVKHSGKFAKAELPLWKTAPHRDYEMPIAQLRWNPLPYPKEPTTFLTGMRTMTTSGDADTQTGMSAHVYLATRSMTDEAFWNADGELLIVLQEGRIRFVTEFGIIESEPGEIVIIPRGVVFRAELMDKAPHAAMSAENYGGAFTLPERGPIGANCLANARDFLTPVAAYEDNDTATRLTVKWGGSFWQTTLESLAVRRRRLARQLCALQIRPEALLTRRRDRLRSSRSLDLHSAFRAIGDARHFQHRFRDLPRALDGRGKHLPPALVSSQHHERVHGARLRPVRRQAARLHAGRLQPAQLHAGARPRPRCIRACLEHGAETGQADQHARLHVRDALSPTRDKVRSRIAGVATRLRGVLGRARQEVRSE